MIILASGSPRRQELLARIRPEFTVDPAQIDERALPMLPPEAYVMMLAEAKGKDVSSRHPGATVIAADTMVAFDGEMLGKPTDEADARAMITKLAGRTHTSYTGLWIRHADGTQDAAVVGTDIVFLDLTPAEIDAYIATGDWQDKAGAFSIQDAGAMLVEAIHGDYYNVVGLPLSTLARMIRAED